MHCNNITVNITNKNIKQSEVFECKINFSINDIIETLDIVNLKPKFMMEKSCLDYLINQMDLNNCQIMSKESSIYYVKSKFYSLISINQYI